jgi:hypothetical protein
MLIKSYLILSTLILSWETKNLTSRKLSDWNQMSQIGSPTSPGLYWHLNITNVTITRSRKYVDKGDVTGVMLELWENKEIAVMDGVSHQYPFQCSLNSSYKSQNCQSSLAFPCRRVWKLLTNFQHQFGSPDDMFMLQGRWQCLWSH